MPDSSGANRPARTVLEQLIRDRRQTLEEFAAYAETFALEHKEPGTLSVRHLQRLIAGRRADGRPLGPVRPATARLLENIFGIDIDDLLAPSGSLQKDDSVIELRERLQISARVDSAVAGLLYEQLDAVRRLDRQLGANVAYHEVQVKIQQVKKLLSYSISPGVRARLSALLTELCMLAGWQALDLRNAVESWQHYEQAKYAANESDSVVFEAHASAQQAFVLVDIDRSSEAVELLAEARRKAANSSSPLHRAWLAAAHGEALAADSQHLHSLRAFDDAASLLPINSAARGGPYVALDSVHLSRWRGHALARLGDRDAVPVLTDALNQLDPSFTRAETALRVDLAIALVAISEQGEALRQTMHAHRLAEVIGSARQKRRIRALRKKA